MKSNSYGRDYHDSPIPPVVRVKPVGVPTNAASVDYSYLENKGTFYFWQSAISGKFQWWAKSESLVQTGEEATAYAAIRAARLVVRGYDC